MPVLPEGSAHSPGTSVGGSRTDRNQTVATEVGKEKDLNKEYKAANEERLARERGRTLPHYSGKVAKKLASGARRGKVTPSKRAKN